MNKAVRMPETNMLQAKATLRAQAMAHRAMAAARAGADAASEMTALALTLLTPERGVSPDSVIAGYWPVRDEADSRPLLQELARRGHVLALPVVTGQDLVFRKWRPGDALKRGPFGTSEPSAEQQVLTPSVLIAPLLAFDYAGTRLGFGGGFYDRALRGLRAQGRLMAIGLAFEAQKIVVLPSDLSDEPLDAVATEVCVREFVKGGRR
jgi:5-formyltetrahydrofolate cyclo-ligase